MLLDDAAELYSLLPNPWTSLHALNKDHLLEVWLEYATFGIPIKGESTHSLRRRFETFFSRHVEFTPTLKRRISHLFTTLFGEIHDLRDPHIPETKEALHRFETYNPPVHIPFGLRHKRCKLICNIAGTIIGLAGIAFIIYAGIYIKKSQSEG